MTKEVGLIIPPSAFLLDERVFISLGILKVAASLEQSGYRVEVLDLSGITNYLETLEAYLQQTQVRVIGITTTTPQLPAVTKIINTIESYQPDGRIILGGPHVTLTLSACKLEAKKNLFGGRAHRSLDKLSNMVDVLVAGDGEFAIFQALQDNPPKIVDADDLKSGMFLSDAQFTASPWPARHLVDMASYKYSIEGYNATSIISQLGCPFACSFCGGRNSKSLRIPRTRTTESVVKELDFLYQQYGYTGWMFYDDELNVNKELIPLMNQISDLQENLGIDFRLRGFVKAELFTDEQAKAMYRAGFRWLLCGFESADPRILVNINKRATVEDNTRCVEIAKRNGLKIKALMSVGHPGEREESLVTVKDWLIKNEVDDFDCTIITTYPGTPYYDEAVRCTEHGERNIFVYTQPKTGDKLYSWELDYTTTSDYYKGDPEGGYKAFVHTDYLSESELVSGRDNIEREVRDKLRLSFNPSRASLRYEHSMGQGLPDFIFRRSIGN